MNTWEDRESTEGGETASSSDEPGRSAEEEKQLAKEKMLDEVKKEAADSGAQSG